MKVAECLILDTLKSFEPIHQNWEPDAEPLYFETLAFLEESTIPCPETLYLTTYDVLLRNKAFSSEDSHIVCCGISSDALPAQMSSHLLLLRPDIHIYTAFNVLSRLFQSLWEWDAKLNSALLSGADAQTFIDLSEHLFTNPVVLITDTLRVAAISQRINISHPDIQFMRDKKYIPENMVQQLTSKPYLEKAESYHSIGFYYPPNYINCTIVIRKFDSNPWFLNILCIYGVNQEPTHSDLVLLDYLGEYILEATKRQQKLNSQFSNRSSSFLYSLLSDTIDSEEELNVTASLLNLPLNSKYQLYVVSFHIPLESHSRYVLLNLEQLLPSFLKLIYHESILILDQLSDDGKGHEKYIMDALRLLLPINNAFCGISQVFSNLRLLKDAYWLSKRTAEIGNKFHPEAVYYHFKDYYSYILLSATAQSASLPLLYVEQLDSLLEYDRQHKSNNMELLCKLLEFERNITDVSKNMHLHRNSVLYRVDKIEQILGMSLDDPDVRLQLLLSFKALDLIEKSNESSQEAKGTAEA